MASLEHVFINLLFSLTDIMTESTSCDYDSGVDCCERPVADKSLHGTDTKDIQLNPSKLSTDTENPVSKLYSSVASHSITPKAGSALQKSAIENTRQMKHVRRKKRRHLLTVRRRKNRPRDILISREQTVHTCEQTAGAREHTFNGNEQNDNACDADIPDMRADHSFDLADEHSNVEFHVGNTASLEMVTITDHVIADDVHVTDECEHIIIDSDQDTTMHLEDSANVVSEAHHVLDEIEQETNGCITVYDACYHVQVM